MPKGTGDAASSTAIMTPIATTCPWKKTETTVASTSFRELMDGDLAAKLQKEEDEKFSHDMR
jgi:hypothetical protein